MSNLLLQNIIKHAYDTVPYYKQIFDKAGVNPETINSADDLKKLPVLTKDDIQEAPGKLISKNYLAYPNCEHLTVQRTSGSTGRIVKVYWANEDYTRSLFYLWNIRERKYGISPSSKFCSFHLSPVSTGDESGQQDIKILNSGRVLSLNKLELNESRLKAYYQHILEFEPQWLFVQPSICYLFASFIRENNLKTPPSIKYIELTGEYLFEHYRNEIQDAFKVPVINMYGSIETNGIAIECSHGHLHCLSKNVIVEIFKDGQPIKPEEEGEIYLTCLTNYAMPFIRYAIGDRGALFNSKTCPCGNKNPILKVFAGRVSDYVTVKGKSPINAFIFSRAVENVNSRHDYPIKQFQVIQQSYEHFTVWLVLKDKIHISTEDITQQFIKEMNFLGLCNLNWDVRFTNKILPSPATGKLQFFVNNTDI